MHGFPAESPFGSALGEHSRGNAASLSLGRERLTMKTRGDPEEILHHS